MESASPSHWDLWMTVSAWIKRSWGDWVGEELLICWFLLGCCRVSCAWYGLHSWWQIVCHSVYLVCAFQSHSPKPHTATYCVSGVVLAPEMHERGGLSPFPRGALSWARMSLGTNHHTSTPTLRCILDDDNVAGLVDTGGLNGWFRGWT